MIEIITVVAYGMWGSEEGKRELSRKMEMSYILIGVI